MATPRDVAKLACKLRECECSAWRALASIVRACLTHPVRRVSPRDREEIACDALAAVWQSLGRVRDDLKLLAYVRTTVRRLTIKTAHRNKRFEPLRHEPTCSGGIESHPIETQELYQALRGALENADRELFRLLYATETDASAIEAQLHLSHPAFRKKKHFLHKKLRAVATRYQAGGSTPLESKPAARRSSAPGTADWDGAIEAL